MIVRSLLSLLLLALLTTQVLEEFDHAARREEFAAQRSQGIQDLRAFRLARDALNKERFALRPTVMGIADAQRLLIGEGTLQAVSSDEVLFTTPQGGRAVLWFDQGGWREVIPFSATSSGIRRYSSRYTDTWRDIGTAAQVFGRGLSCVLFALFVAVPAYRRRCVIAKAMLVAASVGLAATLPTLRPWDLQTLTHGDAPFWDILAVVISLLCLSALRWLIPAPPGNPRVCQECRYNLTGNTTGRCPECGAAVAPAPKPAGEAPRTCAGGGA